MTCYNIIKHPLFDATSLSVIVINSITMAMETEDSGSVDPSELSGPPLFLYYMDIMFIYIYTLEMILKILGLGFLFNDGAYLKNSWNILDFVIVCSALFEKISAMQSQSEEGGKSKLAALRTLRILRPLKTIAKSDDLKVILQAIISSIPMLLNIMIVLGFFVLVMAIAGT